MLFAVVCGIDHLTATVVGMVDMVDIGTHINTMFLLGDYISTRNAYVFYKRTEQKENCAP